ncbi:hypothetical protein EMCLV075R [Equine molluscum contagiosum-like virus]|nr:hypothetical protein EMCLV075R [Equine molluscum contagiosum-like virus]
MRAIRLAAVVVATFTYVFSAEVLLWCGGGGGTCGFTFNGEDVYNTTHNHSWGASWLNLTDPAVNASLGSFDYLRNKTSNSSHGYGFGCAGGGGFGYYFEGPIQNGSLGPVNLPGGPVGRFWGGCTNLTESLEKGGGKGNPGMPPQVLVSGACGGGHKHYNCTVSGNGPYLAMFMNGTTPMGNVTQAPPRLGGFFGHGGGGGASLKVSIPGGGGEDPVCKVYYAGGGGGEMSVSTYVKC